MSQGANSKDLCILLGEEIARKKCQAEKPPAAGPSGRCSVCLEDLTIVYLFMPCGHASTCERCTNELRMRRSTCPICRKHIESTIRVFLS